FLNQLKEVKIAEKRLEDGRDRYFTMTSYNIPYNLNGEECATGEHPFGATWSGQPAARITECETLTSVADNDGCGATLRNFVAAEYCSLEAFGGSLREAQEQLERQTAIVNELKASAEG